MKNNSKKADRIQEPPRIAVKFSEAVFLLGLLFSVFILAYYLVRILVVWVAFDPTEYIFHGYYLANHFLCFRVLRLDVSLEFLTYTLILELC